MIAISGCIHIIGNVFITIVGRTNIRSFPIEFPVFCSAFYRFRVSFHNPFILLVDILCAHAQTGEIGIRPRFGPSGGQGWLGRFRRSGRVWVLGPGVGASRRSGRVAGCRRGIAAVVTGRQHRQRHCRRQQTDRHSFQQFHRQFLLFLHKGLFLILPPPERFCQCFPAFLFHRIFVDFFW